MTEGQGSVGDDDLIPEQLNSSNWGTAIIHFGLNETKIRFPLYDCFTRRQSAVVTGLCIHTLPYPVTTFTCRQIKRHFGEATLEIQHTLLPRLSLLHGWRGALSPGTVKQHLKTELLWNLFCYYVHFIKVIPTGKTLRFIHEIYMFKYVHTPKKISYIHTSVCVYIIYSYSV